LRTQINNFDAGRGYAHQIDQYLPAPDETESSITPSTLLILGVLIGCLAAAGFLLFFMLAAGSASVAKPHTSEQGVGVIPDAARITQPAEGQNQNQNQTPMRGHLNRPHPDRTPTAQRTSGQNEYKSATVVTAPGHTPKMLESQ
jgi:hypothetical protein